MITDGGDADRRLNKVLGGDCVVRRISAAPRIRRPVCRDLAALRLPAERCRVPPDPLYRYQIAQVRTEVDLARLNEEAAALSASGTSALSVAGGKASQHDPDPARAGWSARTIRPMAGVIECTVRADAFCHSMVRSLVGALVAVATGQRDHEWLAAITEPGSGLHDPVMPAAGLTLGEVGYPADHELAARALGRALRGASRS